MNLAGKHGANIYDISADSNPTERIRQIYMEGFKKGLSIGFQRGLEQDVLLKGQLDSMPFEKMASELFKVVKGDDFKD